MKRITFCRVLTASKLADHAVHARWFARGLKGQRPSVTPNETYQDYERGAWVAGREIWYKLRPRLAKRWAERILRLLDQKRKRDLGRVDFVFDMPWGTPGYSDHRWPEDQMWHFRDKTIRDLDGDTWASAAAEVEYVTPYPLYNLAQAFRWARKLRMFEPTTAVCPPDWANVGSVQMVNRHIHGHIHQALKDGAVLGEGLSAVIVQTEKRLSPEGWVFVIKSLRHGYWDPKLAVFRKPVGVERVR